MTDPNLIRQIEELSMNAFPPLQSIHDDGWVLQFGDGIDGYPRRINACYPLYPGSRALEEKIKSCETLYRAKDRKVIFKMTSASLPANLDETLTAKGYEAGTHTALQLLDLGAWSGHADANVSLSEAPSNDWLTAFCQMREISEEHRPIHARILGRIMPARRFASITINGQIVACGSGVLQNGFIGFYDITTHAAVRRQGYSFRLMETLLAWAKAQGATHGYLQVMTDNPPALSLYAKLGFKEAYRYWYRSKL